MSTFTATCLVGRVGANALVGSELHSNNQDFLMHVTEARLPKGARRISVSLMENYTSSLVYKLKSHDN